MKLNYKKLGNGQPLIVVHGLFGSLDNWMTMARSLSDRFEIYLVDQRNHGKSPHSDQMSYDLMAADLVEFIEEHQLDNVNLIGHSMGGKAILKLALQNPELINKMAVVDIGIKSYPMHHQKILAGLHALDLPTLESRKQAELRISEFIGEKGVQYFLLKGLYRKQDGSYGLKFNLNSLEENMPLILSEITGKISQTECLFIRGGLSGYIVDEDYDSIKQQFVNAKIETIEDSGHWIHAEKPDELRELFFKFF